MSGTGWRDRAACRGVDPETFFPTAHDGPVYAAQVAVAKSVCAGCPVRAECLDEALVRIPFGIAGGLTPEERRGHRQRVGKADVSTLETGLRPGASRAELEAAGRVLLVAGLAPREVAERCGVADRTVTRWISRLRAEALPDTGTEGSHGGHRAPLLISHPHGLLAGNTSSGRPRS
jgi:hypothetical protein